MLFKAKSEARSCKDGSFTKNYSRHCVYPQRGGNMIAITGITGRIGGGLAGHLLAQGQAVRGVVRDPKKGENWRQQGCKIAVAEPLDKKALTAAFRSAEAVFILPPPIFDPHPGFAEAFAAMTAHRMLRETQVSAKYSTFQPSARKPGKRTYTLSIPSGNRPSASALPRSRTCAQPGS
ncbi:NmrA family NAD(P)-binding protein [Tunturibacter empetritectus]|uniref:NmrA family NAD(P)-binding protein n=1 Tax=Tunturiibacter empetritectus TaxID=3069691 RepID=UPI00333F7398